MLGENHNGFKAPGHKTARWGASSVSQAVCRQREGTKKTEAAFTAKARRMFHVRRSYQQSQRTDANGGKRRTFSPGGANDVTRAN